MDVSAVPLAGDNMARTKQQLTDLSAARIRERNHQALIWAEFVAIVNATLVPEQELILRVIKNGRMKRLGRLLFNEIDKKLIADANTEAIAILADNNATLAELDKIL